MITAVLRTINSTCSSVVFSITITTALLYHHHPFCPSLFVFAVLNALLGKVLKVLLAKERPPQTRGKKRSLGMPSTHANAMSFHAGYIAWAVFDLQWESSGLISSGLLAGGGVYVVLLTYALCVCYARVYLTHDHTVEQILAGLALGTVDAYLARTHLYRIFAEGYTSRLLPVMSTLLAPMSTHHSS